MASVEALRVRLPELEGKANKKERTAVNKELYALENDDAYAAAVKRSKEGERSGWVLLTVHYAGFLQDLLGGALAC